MWVRDGVEASGGDFRREPVGFGEAYNEWGEVGLDLMLGELVADFVQGLNGLERDSQRAVYQSSMI